MLASEKNQLRSKLDEVFIIHYACSSYHEKLVKISCIAVEEAKPNGKTHTYSRSEYSEKVVLEKFYYSIKMNQEAIYVGWDFRDTTYGLPVLEKRYRQLFKKRPPEIRDLKNLKSMIEEEYGALDHGSRGKLHHLMELNGISADNFIQGEDEAKYFKEKKFREIEMSTNRKVHGITAILRLYLESKLKTQIGVPMTIWRKLKTFVNKIVESTVAKIILLISAILAIIYFVMYLWG